MKGNKYTGTHTYTHTHTHTHTHIQSAIGLKARAGAKKAEDTAITATNQENAIKKTFGKRFAILFDFDFFKHPVYAYELKEDLIVGLESNSSEKVTLRSAHTAGTY